MSNYQRLAADLYRLTHPTKPDRPETPPAPTEDQMDWMDSVMGELEVAA